jgi:hypothetical protein
MNVLYYMQYMLGESSNLSRLPLLGMNLHFARCAGFFSLSEPSLINKPNRTKSLKSLAKPDLTLWTARKTQERLF